jgi:thiol:disulfide interchange protein DsbD
VVLWLLGGVAWAQPGFGDEPAVKVRAVPQKSVAHPGDPLAIAVVLSHEEGYHTWPHEPIIPPELGEDFPAIATDIEILSVPPGTLVREIQWPEPSPVTVNYTMEPIELISYTGEAIAYVPVIIAVDQEPGDIEVKLKVSYQACDEISCYWPEEVELTVPIEIVPAGTMGQAGPNEPQLFADFDSSQFGVAAEGADGAAAESSTATTFEPLDINVFGWETQVDPRGPAGLVLLLLIAAVGGLLLNFTPCVLPVIPLKIMGLSHSAGNPRRLLLLGVLMSFGVVAFWLVLGGAIAFIAGFDAISSLFQTGWFSLIVGLIVGVMAIGMFGVFEVTLPQRVYAVRPDQETLHGAFLFGIMTAVLSTPCTAPFMGAASAWAATQAPPITMLTFAAIGAGMAIPYMLLSARPQLVSRVPRSGPASVLVKQVLGLLMLAVAAFFVGLALSSVLQTPPDPPSRLYWWPVAIFIIAAFVWLAIRTFQLSKRTRLRVLTAGLAVVVTVASIMVARDLTSHGPIEWTYYTAERFAEAQADGDVIVLDFTAEWCLNCRALEEGVLNQPEVSSLLNSDDVVAMRVDLTGDNPEGKAKLKELDWIGIPLLAIFGPGVGYEDPLKFDTYTIGVVTEAIETAQGEGKSASASP